MEQFGMRMFSILEYVGSFHEDQSDTLGLGTKAYFWMQENTRVSAYQVKLSFQAKTINFGLHHDVGRAPRGWK